MLNIKLMCLPFAPTLVLVYLFIMTLFLKLPHFLTILHFLFMVLKLKIKVVARTEREVTERVNMGRVLFSIPDPTMKGFIHRIST